MKFPWISLWLSLAVSTSILAQSSGTREGLKLGPLIVRPSIDAEAGYDDRASIVAGKGVEEVYSQWGAAVGLSNDAARYGFTADAKYGQRYYRDNSELNDDFYSLGASLSSARNSIQWGLASSLTKSLSYNTLVDSTAAEAPVGILTDETTRNITASAGLSYEHAITERTGISPYVGATHFFQDLGTQTNAEWQTYNAGCEVAFAYSDRTLLSLVADHGVQVNDDEDGSVSSLTVGSRSRATDNITWDAEIGFASADYDISGTDQGLTANLRIIWQLTEKVSMYAFGGQDYQPGYDGNGAREVYRAGYGADWQLSPRWSFSGQGLHNYEKNIGAGSGDLYDGVEHFYSISTTHSLTDRAAVSCGINYANDEYEVDQLIYYIRLSASL